MAGLDPAIHDLNFLLYKNIDLCRLIGPFYAIPCGTKAILSFSNLSLDILVSIKVMHPTKDTYAT